MSADKDSSAQKVSNLIDVGRITAVYGIKGWVKIHSDTEPADNIFNYTPWWLKTRHGVKCVEVDAHRPHGNGLVAHLKGVDDRDLAEQFCRVSIAVERDQIPQLESGEYYWHQLEGLQVISEFEGQRYALGRVKQMLETGANDVLVVQGEEGSLDANERLIPYVPGQFVKHIDLGAGTILVDWDPEF
ncbi:ribosome maturation factor RimM [Pseudomaricurvus alcaniphilus]|uniref:ribosome maturation factor RimM n=1 Tax=Pseudomaricurvus alcaniphilus TaxID=1166482 RepID=UPI001408C49D|nr:ribosome maturation factor RimM [Pseudomaricurvus alcaniphilus]NHN36200.1 ribosome maturation factor RimM [Pseudomaricurvus alcaniphilus]